MPDKPMTRDKWGKLKPASQWAWIIKNKSKIYLMLDNDETYVRYYDDVDDELDGLALTNWIGSGPGIPDVLALLDIDYEYV